MPKSAETLLIDGPDARAFAHAQFSSKVDALQIGHWQFSAWLGAQGRVRALFHLARLTEDKYLLLLRGGTAAVMAEALQRFVFRSKLTIAALPPKHLSTGPALPMHAAEQTDETVSLGCDTHAMQIGGAPSGDNNWLPLQLQMGWPWLPETTLGELLPAALALQHLQAVAVDKGCYPGQEIVARLHFRGGHKRHLHSGTLSQPLTDGQTLRIDGTDVGCALNVLTDHAHTHALLILSDDIAARLEQGLEQVFENDLQIRLTASWPA